MKLQSFLFFCATLAVVTASCCYRSKPQKYSQIISVPVSSKRLPCYSSPPVPDRYPKPCRSTPVSSRRVCQAERYPVPSCASVEATPLVADNVYSAGNCRVPSVVSNNVWGHGSSVSVPAVSTRTVPVSVMSDNALSNGFYSGSSSLQATNGPEPAPLQIIDVPPISLPPIESPPVLLPSSQPIPPTRVIAQRCICTKTIVRPQVYRRIVTVPKLQSYIKRTVNPVVENVAYKSTPFAQSELPGASSAASSSASSFASYPEATEVVLSSGSESNDQSSCQSGFYSPSSPVVVSQDSSSDFVPSEPCSYSCAVEESSDCGSSSPDVYSPQTCNSSPVVYSSQSCDSSPVVYSSQPCNSSPVVVSSDSCQNSQSVASSDSCQSAQVVSSGSYQSSPALSDSLSSYC